MMRTSLVLCDSEQRTDAQKSLHLAVCKEMERMKNRIHAHYGGGLGAANKNTIFILKYIVMKADSNPKLPSSCCSLLFTCGAVHNEYVHGPAPWFMPGWFRS